MKRYFTHYSKWEDWQNGLYKKDNQGETAVIECMALLSSRRFYKVGYKLITDWPIAAKVKLTNLSRNRRAWIGQASCCIEYGANEETVKTAWNRLTINQKLRANKIADKLIHEWTLCQKNTQK